MRVFRMEDLIETQEIILIIYIAFYYICHCLRTKGYTRK